MKPNTTRLVVLGLAVGVILGLGGFTLYYARAGVYLTDNAAACANCHIMRDHYEAWYKSSHHAVATCNDCHTPHNPVAKYAAKSLNGFEHSYAFTSGNYPQNIQIKARNWKVTEAACRNCHKDITDAIEGPHREAARVTCLRCHTSVGHMSEMGAVAINQSEELQ